MGLGDGAGHGVALGAGHGQMGAHIEQARLYPSQGVGVGGVAEEGDGAYLAFSLMLVIRSFSLNEATIYSGQLFDIMIQPV